MNNLDFKFLDEILVRFGLEKAWVNLLATQILNDKKFHYILDDPFFKDFIPLKKKIFNNLSIGEIGILYEYSQAQQSVQQKKIDGIYFTPNDIAHLMATYSHKFQSGIWLDPCCGIGNLSWHLIDVQKNKEQFLKNNLILSDKDKLSLFIARVLLTLSFQEQDSHLFFNIQDKFVELDFLSVNSNSQNLFFDKKNMLSKIPIHDFVIMNPPYLSTDKNSIFETAECGDLYAYFLENVIKTSVGFISITPQSFTNATKFQSLRKLLLETYSGLNIYNVPGNVFSGIKFGSQNSNKVNSIRASIMVAGAKDAGFKITPLLRWQTAERAILLAHLDEFLTEVELTASYFPKVNKNLAALFEIVKNKKTLKTICSKKRTQYVLYIPSSPRYYISALKKPVSRSSMKTIYFHTKEEMNKAYLLLNSSFLYWWWRVRDGGMTLSLQTLETLPLLDVDINDELVHELENSEKKNKVYKINAGKVQENIKHPQELVRRITNYILPDYGQFLALVHQNSDLYLIDRKNK